MNKIAYKVNVRLSLFISSNVYVIGNLYFELLKEDNRVTYLNKCKT